MFDNFSLGLFRLLTTPIRLLINDPGESFLRPAEVGFQCFAELNRTNEVAKGERCIEWVEHLFSALRVKKEPA